ncbi:MAG TPA: hypothetical protein DCX27_05180, partial [Balneola sp.]|nr:hypothetical protein [Balneola sp.]
MYTLIILLIIATLFFTAGVIATRTEQSHVRIYINEALIGMALVTIILIAAIGIVSGITYSIRDDGPMEGTKHVIKVDDPLNIVDGRAVVYCLENTIWTPKYVAIRDIRFVEHGKEIYKLKEVEDTTTTKSKWLYEP